MPKLNIDKHEEEFLDHTILHWKKEGLISDETADNLRSSYEVKGFDWAKLAQYSFYIALACGLIALASLVIDDTVIKFLQQLYNTPDIAISGISAFIAAFLFYYGQKQKRIHPEKVFSNEAVIFLGVLFTACSIAFLGKALDNGSGRFSILFLLSVFIYGLLAVKFKSKLIWAFALISFGSWFGTETGYQTNWSNYFLGMNYPLRFVLFGAIMILLNFIIRKFKVLEIFGDLTYIIGLMYLFISLWLLSIFGNFGTIEDWSKVKQVDLIFWSVISCLVALGFMLYGLKKKDIIAREFGIIFLLINIYSRYFEYLWDITDKTIFFSILAISFWLIGRKAEKIWNVDFIKHKST